MAPRSNHIKEAIDKEVDLEHEHERAQHDAEADVHQTPSTKGLHDGGGGRRPSRRRRTSVTSTSTLFAMTAAGEDGAVEGRRGGSSRRRRASFAAAGRATLATVVLVTSLSMLASPDGVNGFMPSDGPLIHRRLETCYSGSYISQWELCEDCPAGYYTDQVDQTECAACASGRYQASSGETACSSFCPPNKPVTTGLVGQATEDGACTTRTGTKYPGGDRGSKCSRRGYRYHHPYNCDACVAISSYTDYYDGWHGCGPGQYQVGASQHYCPGATNPRCYWSCGKYDRCTADKYKPCKCSTCAVCPSGQYTDDASSDICSMVTSCHGTPCPAGEVGPIGATTAEAATCTGCPAGQYGHDHTGQRDCLACPTGWWQGDTGKTSCEMCPRGTAAPQADIGCEECVSGKYWDSTLEQRA